MWTQEPPISSPNKSSSSWYTRAVRVRLINGGKYVHEQCRDPGSLIPPLYISGVKYYQTNRPNPSPPGGVVC
jgi:hypothetical protein